MYETLFCWLQNKKFNILLNPLLCTVLLQKIKSSLRPEHRCQSMAVLPGFWIAFNYVLKI